MKLAFVLLLLFPWNTLSSASDPSLETDKKRPLVLYFLGLHTPDEKGQNEITEIHAQAKKEFGGTANVHFVSYHNAGLTPFLIGSHKVFETVQARIEAGTDRIIALNEAHSGFSAMLSNKELFGRGFADHLAGIIKTSGVPIEKVIVAGRSLGGFVAGMAVQLLAEKYQEKRLGVFVSSMTPPMILEGWKLEKAPWMIYVETMGMDQYFSGHSLNDDPSQIVDMFRGVSEVDVRFHRTEEHVPVNFHAMITQAIRILNQL